MICIQKAHIPEVKKTKDALQWIGYINSKLKESRGLEKHSKRDYPKQQKMQTKLNSLIEAITNTAVGFCISLLATFIIFPIVGIESTGIKNVIITLFFTVISIIRGYVLRRIFNKQKNNISKNETSNRTI